MMRPSQSDDCTTEHVPRGAGTMERKVHLATNFKPSGRVNISMGLDVCFGAVSSSRRPGVGSLVDSVHFPRSPLFATSGSGAPSWTFKVPLPPKVGRSFDREISV